MCQKLIAGMAGKLNRFAAEQEAATATEYAVMLALIIVVAIGAINTLGGTVSNLFVTIETSLFA